MAADSRYGELLVRAGALSSEQLQQGLKALPKSGVHLSEHLAQSGVLDEHAQSQAVGKILNLTLVSLEHLDADQRAVARIPGPLALEHLVVPIELMPGERGELLQIAMVDPTSTAAIRSLSAASRCLLRPVIAPISQVRTAIEKLYGLRRSEPNRRATPKPSPLVSPSPVTPPKSEPTSSTADTAGFSDLFTAQTPTAGQSIPQRTPVVSRAGGEHTEQLERLERALRAGEPAARRIFVRLVAQLAKQGLVDINRLLDDE